jgi:hypothetical protein
MEWSRSDRLESTNFSWSKSEKEEAVEIHLPVMEAVGLTGNKSNVYKGLLLKCRCSNQPK